MSLSFNKSISDELRECVRPFCGVGEQRVKGLIIWRISPRDEISSRFAGMKFHPPLKVIFN